MWRTLIDLLDQQGLINWEETFIDASFAAAKKGPAVGTTKGGKGTKLMVVADGQGIPLGGYLCSASPAEVTLVEATWA